MSELEGLMKSMLGSCLVSSTSLTLQVLEIIPALFEKAPDLSAAIKHLEELSEWLSANRPTSVMTFFAINALARKLEEWLMSKLSKGVEEVVRAECLRLRGEIDRATQVVASLAAKRVLDGMTVLTCSNSKAVAALFQKLKSEGKGVRVIVAESRPGGEGVETAKELSELGFDTELIVDSAVRYFMKDVDLVVVGAEAIAANGAVVNKIGTSMIALAAHEARVRVLVVATTHKFSSETVFGELVKLPLLKDLSLLPGLERADVTVNYPLFDVTPPSYVDAIATERGVVAPEAVLLLLGEIYGWPAQPSDVLLTLKRLEVVACGGSG